jgi:predicted ferric reductase
MNKVKLATPWVVAAVMFSSLYAIIWNLQAHNASAAAVNMPDMGMADMQKFWAFPIMQAAGLTALVLAWFSVAIGLKQAVGKKEILGFNLDRLHRDLGILVIALVFAHAFVDIFDAMGDSLATNFWFNGWAKDWPDANAAYNIGVFSFYMLVLLAFSYYGRKSIGEKAWRFAHRFILIAYGLSVWHTLALGADVAYYGPIRPLLWLAQIPLLWWFALAMKKRSRVLEYLGYAGVALVVILVVTRWYLYFPYSFQSAPSVW